MHVHETNLGVNTVTYFGDKLQAPLYLITALIKVAYITIISTMMKHLNYLYLEGILMRVLYTVRHEHWMTEA